ncbi:MAG TPA: OmpA family protein [Candidatus Eisenbacteria bacterium]|nr:OmpA family protein [Candidatus Eisenbacteria bacterium]
MNLHRVGVLLLGLAAAVLFSPAIFAKDQVTGKIKITVVPKQAYTFVDGKAIGHGDQTIKVDVGAHHLLIANYGYKFVEQDVSVDSRQTVPVSITLEPSGDPVPGPHGRIQIEIGSNLEASKFHGPTEAAVLLNGKSPKYFVGHLDEFNHDIIWHQELLVPPGTHQVTVTRYGHELWSGPVTVAADQRVILTVADGKQKIKPWTRGSEKFTPPTQRFKAGIASATVIVAPVSGSVTATPAKINCNQPTQLAWVSKDTVDADMSGMSPVPTSGERTVSPHQTTTYQLTASGPGGTVTPSATVEVNPVVESSLTASPMEISYRRIGDKVLEQGSTTLNWTSSNADTLSLDPLGTVAASGSKSIPLVPTQTTNGPVDEEFKYTLSASNACGGTETKTVAVRLKGSVEPIPAVPLQSVFFPTAYPTKQDPALGLVRSQQEALGTLAAGFKKYLEYDPDAKLTLSGYADERGGEKYNDTLSDRRVERVKDFLVSQGITPEKIETSSYGEKNQLDKAAVADLQSRNPNKPEEKREKNKQATWLAYNRRVDIVLVPTNAQSERFYPNGAPDSLVIWQKPKPPLKTVEANN